MSARVPSVAVAILMICGCVSPHYGHTIAKLNRMITDFNKDRVILDKVNLVTTIEYSVQDGTAVCRDAVGDTVVTLTSEPDGRFSGVLQAEVGVLGSEEPWTRVMPFYIEGEDLRSTK